MIRAAEDPRPVLWTSEMGTAVWRNAGREVRDARVGGRLREVSYSRKCIEYNIYS